VPEMAKLPKVISSLKFSEGFCPLSSQKRAKLGKIGTFSRL
jgi:hypothetical protein